MPTPERQEADRLFALFQARGATPVEIPVLVPSETLLDLYGEDLRTRAYVTSDPLQGEMMLRPDFTVPVVQMHMAQADGAARYTYRGEVFRKQITEVGRSNQYLQVGLELIDHPDPHAAEAEIFASVRAGLRDLPCQAVTGDMGVVLAAIEGLETSAARKAALVRHIWRPGRFRTLMDRFRGRVPVPEARARIAALPPETVRAEIAAGGPAIGLRSSDEIEARIATLADEARTPPIPAAQAAMLDDILSLRANAAVALTRLRDIGADLPSIAPVLDRMARRLDALDAAGVDPQTLAFEGSFGRSAMEYYDGFVFGFVVSGRGELPPVATGGRYDALTRVLGQGRTTPAVGAVIRPAVVVAARNGASC